MTRTQHTIELYIALILACVLSFGICIMVDYAKSILSTEVFTAAIVVATILSIATGIIWFSDPEVE